MFNALETSPILDVGISRELTLRKSTFLQCCRRSLLRLARISSSSTITTVQVTLYRVRMYSTVARVDLINFSA